MTTKERRGIIVRHFNGMGELEKASIKYFLDTGKINGSFLHRLEEIAKEAFALGTLNNWLSEDDKTKTK